MKNILFWDSFKLNEQSGGVKSLLERVLRKIINVQQRKYISKLNLNNLNNKCVCEGLIVSLTTFPDRIEYVDNAIKSILNQTIKPSKVILWLAEEEFQVEDIPDKLNNLCEYGLEIRFCKDNIYGHKKYYYSMLEFPESIIVTYDDDLIYPEDSLEKLIKCHQKFPKCVICNRGREISIRESLIQPYEKWKLSGNISAGIASHKILASTGAGTLYPPGCMQPETFNLTNIYKLALTGDDLWIKAMCIYSNTKVIKTQNYAKALCLGVAVQKKSLAQVNVGKGKNDEIFSTLLKTYTNIQDRLIKDL